MNEVLQRLASLRLPFTTADAASFGIDRQALARMTRTGPVRRVCHGAFVPSPVWTAASPQERYLLVCRGVLGRHRSAALSHTAAVVAHGLPLVGVDLDVVHLTRTAEGRIGRTRQRPHVQVHPPLAAEAGLHRGTTRTTELREALHLVRLGRGRAQAEEVVRLAGRLSESPGETLTRLLLHTLGIVEYQQQARIRLPSGRVARVDFLLPDHRFVIEFDGEVKYEGADGRTALVREKRREDGIRALGHGVVRLVWADLHRPRWVRDLLLAAGWQPAP